jgi:hypothetical protein
MPIKNLELTAIDAKRFTKPGEKPKSIRIDHNSSITMVTQIAEREASIDFRFTATYVGVGVIKIEGRIMFDGDAEALVSQWTSSGQMPNNVANEIHNAIMSNCLPEAMLIARGLRLPPPIPLPRVNVQGKSEGGGKDKSPFGYA